MPRIIASITFSIFLLSMICCAQAAGGKNLVHMEQPQEQVANNQQEMNPFAPPAPTPRDQFYVFWFLGRMISYPIDKLESFIFSKTWRLSPGTPVPASAGPNSSPFDSLNHKEIPPAPPVSGISR
jgi:hypothetical protein